MILHKLIKSVKKLADNLEIVVFISILFDFFFKVLLNSTAENTLFLKIN